MEVSLTFIQRLQKITAILDFYLENYLENYFLFGKKKIKWFLIRRYQSVSQTCRYVFIIV